jgi:tetratricopeptide (TPR) repeat protein
MEHFPQRHINHQIAINYLSTLKWVHNDLTGAKDTFSLHAEIDNGRSVAQWITDIIKSKDYHLGSAFNIYVLLRLAATQGKVSLKAISSVETFLNECDINQHPYELIYKWIGIAYLNIDEDDKALQAFNKSIYISTENKLGFTIQSIAISSLGLKCVTLNRKYENIEDDIEKLRAGLNALFDDSVHFEQYIDDIGGIEQMIEDIENNNISAIARWMPFAYA